MSWARKAIALVGKDRVEPDLPDPVQPDMTIRVTRVREELVVEFEPIPFETVWVPDPDVEIDNIRLVQEGQVGLTKRRYRVVYENDQEVDRYLEDVWAAAAAHHQDDGLRHQDRRSHAGYPRWTDRVLAQDAGLYHFVHSALLRASPRPTPATATPAWAGC